MEHRVSLKIGEEELVLETGKMAKQANGAVFARLGGSAVIATACAAENEKEDLDFIPLSVDYLEKYYAAGKIPGGFIKREGRPKDKEVLVSRLIDRPIRPLFSRLFRREIQVIPIVISTDLVNPPDILAMNAASAAITISDIPFEGPIGAVRIGYVDGALRGQPDLRPDRESARSTLVVAGTAKGITMVEGSARQVSEASSSRPSRLAHPTISELCRIQVELAQKAGKKKLPSSRSRPRSPSARKSASGHSQSWKTANFVKGKETRVKAIKAVRTETLAHFKDRLADTDIKPVKALFEDMEQEIMRASIVGKGRQDRRPFADGNPPHHLRDRRPAAHPRLGPVHARRDAGAGGHHAGNGAGRADHGQHRRGHQEELHAALQLPAVLGRGGGTAGFTRAPRDRARAPGRARHQHGPAEERELSRTRSASSRRSSSPTAPRPWPRSAEAR